MDRKTYIYIIAAAAVIAILGLLYVRSLRDSETSRQQGQQQEQEQQPDTEQPSNAKTVEGTIQDVFADKKEVTIMNDENEKTTVSAGNDTKITDENGSSADFSYLQSGFRVSAIGQQRNADALAASEIKVLQSPNIIVSTPKNNEEIGLPLVIEGKARVFENTVSYRLLDQDGAMLLENHTIAQAPDIGLYGAFKTDDVYPQPKGTSGTVEVFEYSAKDGSEINKVTVPVKFKKVESTTVKVFFGNNNQNPQAIDCNKVFSVNRRIPKTQTVAMAALQELLKGVTTLEARNGYFTSINSGVKVQKLTITGGTARVDFDDALERSVGGSCRVAAIRAEITQTLKQFSTVKDVIISINGRTEDILQP